MMIMMRRSYLSASYTTPMSILMNVLMPVVAVAPPTCADDGEPAHLDRHRHHQHPDPDERDKPRDEDPAKRCTLSRRGEVDQYERSGTQVSLAMLG